MIKSEHPLHQIDSSIHKSKEVEATHRRMKLRTPEGVSQKPDDKISAYLARLENLIGPPENDDEISKKKHQRNIGFLRNILIENVIIQQEDIPQSYWDSLGEHETREGKLQDLISMGVTIEDEFVEDDEGKKIKKRKFIFPQNSEFVKIHIESLQSDQIASLDTWIQYFTSPNSNAFPTWAKYWIFSNILNLSKFDKEKGKFGRRTKTTVAPFPEINREALAYVVDKVSQKHGKEFFTLQEKIREVKNKIKETNSYQKQLQIIETGLDTNGNKLPKTVVNRIKENIKVPEHSLDYYEDQLRELEKEQKELLGIDQDAPEETLWEVIQRDNFAELYAHALEEVGLTKESDLVNTDGEWVLYTKGSDHMPLVNSLQGKGTGWCTAGKTTAKYQLEWGDFYVYYSYSQYDQPGKPSIPRIAIRKEQGQIAEIRGIASNQNLDKYIHPILEKKLQNRDEFPDADEYSKRVNDMNRLSEIDSRYRQGEELTKEDLIFLYELYEDIAGFGYSKDPRATEILASRNKKEDYLLMTGYSPDQISFYYNDFLANPNCKLFIGNITLNETNARNIKLPPEMVGDLDLRSLWNTEGLVLPKKFQGIIKLNSITYPEQLEAIQFPDDFRGELHLESLDEANLDLEERFPNVEFEYSEEHYRRAIELNRVEDLYQKSLRGEELTREELTILYQVYEPIDFPMDSDLPEKIAEILATRDTKADLVLITGYDSSEISITQEEFGPHIKLHYGDLTFSNTEDAQSITLPEEMFGTLDLSRLIDGRGLVLPQKFFGTINLNGLYTDEGITFPRYFEGTLYVEDILEYESDLAYSFPDVDIYFKNEYDLDDMEWEWDDDY